MAAASSEKAQREVESAEHVLLGSRGGDLDGFALPRGDPEKLVRLSMSPELMRLTMRAGICPANAGVVRAIVGAGRVRRLLTPLTPPLCVTPTLRETPPTLGTRPLAGPEASTGAPGAP